VTLGPHLHAPTQPEGELVKVIKKNYLHQFDRPVFSGQAWIPKRWPSGRGIAKKANGEMIWEKRPYEDTIPSYEFLKKHKLDGHSKPTEWFEAFLPCKNKKQDHKTQFTLEKVLSWTNFRARVLESAGLGGKYADFTDFSLKEMKQHMGLCLFQGLSPSPQVEMKFASSAQDPVNGSDFIHNAFGGNTGKSTRRHRHFKCFLTSVNPRVEPPSRDHFPNWKLHPLLKWMMKVCPDAVFIGRNLSCDEQTIGFKGQHRDKQRITYKKAEGDGFLTDCLCSDGYTYSFYFRHQPPSEKIVSTFKCSPLHSRVIALVSQLPDSAYTLGMDNLYMSAKLCRLLYALKQKVMAHGVTRPSLRGVPKIVKQEERKKKGELESVRNTVKVAKMVGDGVCQDLVCVSLYDTKPVYIMTNACPSVEWMKKKGRCLIQ
jgi:hypothetical protein